MLTVGARNQTTDLLITGAATLLTELQSPHIIMWNSDATDQRQNVITDNKCSTLALRCFHMMAGEHLEAEYGNISKDIQQQLAWPGHTH